MKFTGILSRLTALTLATAAAGCIPQQTTSVKCTAPTGGTTAVRTASLASGAATLQKLGISSEQLQTSCASGSQYVCSRRVFSPDIKDGKNSSVQCSSFETLGSPCLNVESFDFNTRQAALQADAAQREPGGSLNYTEYSCHHSGLKDGDTFLARANQYDSLDEALKNAYEACAALGSGGASL
jgi:hypothetical protein